MRWKIISDSTNYPARTFGLTHLVALLVCVPFINFLPIDAESQPLYLAPMLFLLVRKFRVQRLFMTLVALLIALDALRVSNRKKKVDLSTVDKNSGGFLVTHGMVMNEETGDIVSQSDYSETLYRSLSD